MLHVIKDDFDESPEDILNSINKMLQFNIIFCNFIQSLK